MASLLLLAHTPAGQNIGGAYQELPAAESLAGTYMLSVYKPFWDRSPILIVGSNGTSQLTYFGVYDRPSSRVAIGCKFPPHFPPPVGFSCKLPAYGPTVSNGTFKDGRIDWDGKEKSVLGKDKSTWQLQGTAAYSLKNAVNKTFAGFYKVPTKYHEGTFAGTCMISTYADGPDGSSFAAVGSDDGLAFWAVHGTYDSESGAVAISSSPTTGAPATGNFAKGQLTLGGRTYIKQEYGEAEGMGEGAGYVAVAIAVLFFGTNFVPVKRFETGDGMFFQWVMCSAIFCWGLALQCILFLMRDDCVPGANGCRPALTDGRVDQYSVKFIPQAVAGGVLWATGNTMSVPIINSIGLGMGMLIWGCTNMLMGWATGMARLDLNTADPGLVWLNILGVCLAVLALALYTLIKPAEPPAKDVGGDLGDHLVQVASNDVLGSQAVVPASKAGSKRLTGTLMAVVSGLFYGNNFTPPNLLLNTAEGPSNALDYVFSHFCGIYFASTFWMLVYCAYKRSTPVLYPRVILPGFISGLMWSAAQTSWFVANASLSVAVAFPLITSGPGIVSSLWGVFVFKEITGKRNLIVLSAAVMLAVAGCTCIGVAKELPS